MSSESAPTSRIRPIAATDDAALAQLIRTVMPEFGADGPGYAIHDPEVDSMYATYSQPRSGFWVIEQDDRVVGGAGYGPLAGAEPTVCELRKMYFYPEARGHGWGRRLLGMVLDAAKADGFRVCYLETVARMEAARRLYVAAGFTFLDGPMGHTGHHGCDRYMAKHLDG